MSAMKLGSQKCQCAGCGLYFASTDAFDKHRAWRADQPKAMSNRRRECRDPLSVGLVDRGGYFGSEITTTTKEDQK